MDGFNLLKTYMTIPPAQSGMFIFHTFGGQAYLERLNAIPAATTEGCRGPEIVVSATCCRTHPLLLD